MSGFTQSLGFGCATVTLLAIVGCGGPEGPTRYNISGSVTHKGAPLAAGVIYFNPQDRTSPSGFAAIVDGKYDTANNGRGHTGGAQTVRIAVEAPEGNESDWTPPFEPYETNVELPTEPSTKDFDVPGGDG